MRTSDGYPEMRSRNWACLRGTHQYRIDCEQGSTQHRVSARLRLQKGQIQQSMLEFKGFQDTHRKLVGEVFASSSVNKQWQCQTTQKG